jgi:hypothetical protein
MDTQKSEVTSLLQQIELEYTAAQQALTGLASGTARHTFISARMEQMSLHHEALAQLVGSDKAAMLVAMNLDRL